MSETKWLSVWKCINPFDKDLANLYPSAKLINFALGATGIETGIGKPTNYRDTNVSDEILAANDTDGDGMCNATTCELATIKKVKTILGNGNL